MIWLNILYSCIFLIKSTVFIHEPKDKIWISVGSPPKEILFLQVDVNNNSDVVNIEISLTKTVVTTLDKKSLRCNGPEKPDFNTCCKNFFHSYLKTSIKCTVPGKCKDINTEQMKAYFR